MLKSISYILLFILFSQFQIFAQSNSNEVEMGESMQEFIQENHIEEIEDMIHKLASSKSFIEQFIEEEKRHLVDDISFNKRDVRIGDDVDVYVNHITEHQTFTMIMVPISIYNMAIYDTLLFSVIEVSDEWVRREFPYDDIEDDSTKSHLLTLKNHELLAHHLYSQALKISHTSMGQVHVDLNESYISSGSIHEHTSNLSKHEKDEMRRHWGVLKKAFTHVIDLNVEFNIYVFGFNDLEVSVKNRKGDYSITITPKNVFQRHHFLED